jgi:hypothetical protein
MRSEICSLACQDVAKAKADQLSTLSYRLLTVRLLSHFFELCAEHIHVSAVKIATKRDEGGWRTLITQPSTLNSQLLCRYSFTDSICLAITSPVKRSMATCTQYRCSPSTTKPFRRLVAVGG